MATFPSLCTLKRPPPPSPAADTPPINGHGLYTLPEARYDAHTLFMPQTVTQATFFPFLPVQRRNRLVVAAAIEQAAPMSWPSLPLVARLLPFTLPSLPLTCAGGALGGIAVVDGSIGSLGSKNVKGPHAKEQIFL